MSSHSRIVRPSDASRDSTAFLGAIHAFSPPKTPVQPRRVDHNSWNGALAAAIFAGDGTQRKGRKERTTHQEKILPAKTVPLVVGKAPAMNYNYKQTSGSLVEEDLKKAVSTQGQTSSHRPGLRAASKPSGTLYGSISPNLLTNQISDDQSTSDGSLFKDESSILATSALVKLFESHANNTTSTPRVSSFRQTEPAVRSPSRNHIAPSDGEKSETWRSEPVEGITTKKQVPSPPSRNTTSRLFLSPNKFTPEDSTEHPMTRNEGPQSDPLPRRTAPPPPPPRRERRDGGSMQSDRAGLTLNSYSDENSSPSSYVSAVDKTQSPQPLTRPDQAPQSIRNHCNPQSVPEQGRFASAIHPTDMTRHSKRRARSSSAANRQGREGLLLPHSPIPQLTANSLADAMVASSLASSRAASPSKQVPPPIPRRHSKQSSIFRRSLSHDLNKSRTPSPVKGGMRQTMRAPSKAGDDDDDDDDGDNWRRNGHILKKHPNKHREGDRKRWRDEITEQERKRYEGVWAANKGLCMPPGNSELATKVVNLVVRDIWRRSKLPDHVLGEVWDLVDLEGLGRLGKEEFVVGMWLIDQRLKGRKLPVEVSESVWFSARRLTGVKYK